MKRVIACWIFVCTWTAGSLPAQQPSDPRQSATPPPLDALQEIESTRGGRHWIDEQTPPPRSPEATLHCLQVEPGLKVELAAAEPLVMDPVSIVFDRWGKMFVAEYGDYPTGPEKPGAPNLTRIVMLDDTDGDGRMDRRYVFADQLAFAHSLMPFRDGLLVGAQTQILFLKDTDGDHVADIRQVLIDGFTPAHPQMQIGVPKWGLDNWIYWNYGPGKLVWRGPAAWRTRPAAGASDPAPSSPLVMPRKEFRLHPVTMEYCRASGLGQFGNTIDLLGRRFFCTNRNPIITAPIPYRQLARNPYAVVLRDQYDVSPSGGDTHVYPLITMKSNYLSHAGTHTSACGTTAYLGAWLGPEYQNSIFVCEPVGYLVTRNVLHQDGVTMHSTRARPKADFLAATDSWFRPASLATGPDGALYVADMYRLWVEHPKFLPDDVAARIDWRAGEDRGRIWRIVPVDPQRRRPAPFVPPRTVADMVRLLTETNGWRRYLGQRLLVELQESAAAEPLRELLLTHADRNTRLHALWTLDGIGQLTADDLLAALADADVYVRRDAARLAARFLQDHPDVLARVVDLAGDSDPRVRFQVALALGDTAATSATEALVRIAVQGAAEPWFVTAIVSSCRERAGEVLAGLLTRKPRAAVHGALVRELAGVVGARGNLHELHSVLRDLAARSGQASWWQAEVLTGLAIGLPRYRGPLGRMSLARLLAKPPTDLAELIEPIRQVLASTARVALDDQRPIDGRKSAIELLGYQSWNQAAEVFDRLLAVDQPVEIQLATLAAMQRSADAAVGELVLQHWDALGPQVRRAGLLLLLRRTATTRLVLQAMADGAINRAIVDIDSRVRLLRHADPQVKHLAEQIFGGAISANRRAVAQQYEVTLQMQASATAGKQVFDKVCAKCHVIDGQGHDVGQDISDVRNRSRQALLYDILDPNRKLEPRFEDYLVVTVDGRVFNGIMVSETSEAVVLKQAEAKQVVIPRNDIDEIQSSGKSLMPEGMEKEVSLQQMADLLEYLKTRRVVTDTP